MLPALHPGPSLSREDIIFAVTATVLEIKSGPPCNVAGTGEAGPHEEKPRLHGVTRRVNVRDEEEDEQEINALIAQAQCSIAASP